MILRLAHIEVRVRDLGAARAFYADALGFVVAESDPGHLYLRGSEDFETWSLTLTEAVEPGLGHLALRVADPDELDRLERVHRDLGLSVRRVPDGIEPGQGPALRVRGPDGSPLEFVHELEQVTVTGESGVRLPMRRSHLTGGLPPRRIDHVNLRVPDLAGSLDYWQGTLGFSMSEGVERDGAIFAAWLRRKAGTHDVALLGGPEPALHHFAFSLTESADVLRAADLLADAGYARSIEWGPGRHGVTNALFLYVRDPDGNRLELYVGDYVRDLDASPVIWDFPEFERCGRLWWGQPPPPDFQQTTGVNPAWVGADAVLSGVE
jgi:catechol 2,3-dioxygenase